MRAKLALMSGLISMLCAMPALASPTTPPGNHVLHAAAAGVICGDPDTDVDATTTWTSNNLNYKFTMVLPADTNEYLGLRLTAANSQPAQSFQMDVNTANSDDPFFYVFVTNRGVGEVFWAEQYLFDSLQPGFSAVNLRNGFTRWTYTGNLNGLGKGSTFNAIYLWDYNFTDDVTYSDVVTNITVDGSSVLPILNPTPVADCTYIGP